MQIIHRPFRSSRRKFNELLTKFGRNYAPSFQDLSFSLSWDILNSTYKTPLSDYANYYFQNGHKLSINVIFWVLITFDVPMIWKFLIGYLGPLYKNSKYVLYIVLPFFSTILMAWFKKYKIIKQILLSTAYFLNNCLSIVVVLIVLDFFNYATDAQQQLEDACGNT